jgi:dUTP pyrophosphatase
MKVKIKKLDALAQIPKYAKDSDAGMDLVAISREDSETYIEYGTGLAVEIPEGYVGLVFPRSSISKENLLLCNSVGVIDSGYRGEIKCRFKKVEHGADRAKSVEGWNGGEYHISDRVAQLVIIPYPKVEFEVVEDLTETARGVGGFGSTNAV